MHFVASRGGAKPRMLNSGQDLGINVYGQAKLGMYECNGSTMARRVELPTWLSDVFEGLAKTNFMPPQGDIGESGGHIWLKPYKSLFSSPAVGMDLEAWDLLLRTPTLTEVQFHIYGTRYRLFDVWTCSADNFMNNAKRVQTKPCFMPQMMVPISSLKGQKKILH